MSAVDRIEKQLNREAEKFDLSPNKVSEAAEVIDFVTKEKIDETPPKKSSSRLMEKLKKKRESSKSSFAPSLIKIRAVY